MGRSVDLPHRVIDINVTHKNHKKHRSATEFPDFHRAIAQMQSCAGSRTRGFSTRIITIWVHPHSADWKRPLSCGKVGAARMCDSGSPVHDMR